MPSAQILLTFFDMSARTHYVNARQTLRKLLEWRVVPIINENDTTTTDEISFGNNDFLAAQVAILLSRLLVLLTDADGVYTADPRIDPSASIVRRVDDFSALDALDIGHTASPLGTGGMRSKVVAAEMATAAGVPLVIANGLTPATITRAAAGEAIGTGFPARQPATRASSCGSSTPSRSLVACSSTPVPRERCATAAPACCRSGSST